MNRRRFPPTLCALLTLACAEGSLQPPFNSTGRSDGDAAAGTTPAASSDCSDPLENADASVCQEGVDAPTSIDPGTFSDRGPRPGLDKPIDDDRDYANATRRLYLSGTGTDDALDWDFMVTGGARRAEWATLPVPSHWEFHGFGTFRYGSETRTTEQGIYRRAFEVPAEWTGKRVFVVFEGSMTDTLVTVNGRSAGPVHQGAFYRFKYDISDLLSPGALNEIEVTVAKESADASVNEAERQADYWVFGGIFRPVYLEALPSISIERLAINAKADGLLQVDTFLHGVDTDAELVAQVYDEDMSEVGGAFTASVPAGATELRLEAAFENVQAWSAEMPHRYRLAVDLLTADGAVHAVRENFGFRTLEVRAGDGIYVNGTRVMLRGINRHSFWPDSGRALNSQLSFDDVKLLKGMNVNAVRNSHYPADEHFYDVADAVGMYVLDELAGWQEPPYDVEIGRKLIEEMVTFNVNHPSILSWDNGNEGGWNRALDADFARWDPQARPVLHPWASFSDINTDHYESYDSTVAILAKSTLFLPTEFLHGLYDGGGGAGLEDYWRAMRQSPVGAGGFLWAFLDEGVRLPSGKIDVKGNAAPDGVVGPYREKEGSYYTIRQLWSPVQIALEQLPVDFTGMLDVENDYDFTDLKSVEFSWELVTFDVLSIDPGHTVLDSGSARTDSVPAHATGVLELDLPPNFRDADALMLRAVDAAGTLVGEWSWMTQSPAELRQTIVNPSAAAVSLAHEDELSLTLASGDAQFSFSKQTGQLTAVVADGSDYSLKNGPALSVGTATLESFIAEKQSDEYVVTASYSGDLQQVRWRVLGDGWLALSYRYGLSGSYDFFGIDFDYPQANVKSVQWLGKGPYRVWNNRMKGPWHDVWTRDANRTAPGEGWDYPEFEGYFADVYWARLQTTEGPILFVVDSPNLFLRLYRQEDGWGAQTAAMVFPDHDLSFLHGIPAIGDKFLESSELGPQGQQHDLDDTFEATLYLHFGNLP